MIRLSRNEKGFSAVEVMVIVVIVGLIGVTGWFVYKDNHKTTPTSTTTPITSSKAPASNSAKPSSSDAHVVKVSQLGIELVNVPSSISDLTYAVTTVKSSLPHTSAGFSTTSLRSKDSACSDTAGAGSIGSIDHFQGTYNATKDQGPFTFVKQFSGFWIAFTNSGVPCSQNSTTAALQATQGTTFDKLVTDSSNVQLVQ